MDGIDSLRAAFESGVTLPARHRAESLRLLEKAIGDSERAIEEALRQDLNKCAYEAHMTEIGQVRHELRFALRHVKTWARPRREGAALGQFPGTAWVRREPLGVALIISPWNYPFLLSLAPLISALAAGCTAALKPSETAPATGALLRALLAPLEKRGVARVELGGRETSEALLRQPFDTVFFTGSTQVGRIVMQRAAEFLTPVTLELGGKSPAVVDQSADIELAARRILFGKLLNAGQTCVAPDYVLAGQRAVLEGARDRATRRFDLTIVDEPSWDSPLMQEEIFGPILPVLGFDALDGALRRLRALPRPLALYVFARDRAAERAALALPFGGGCVNDTVLHLASPRLPFGGVGQSGMGRYHGKAGFDCFTYEKSLLIKRGRLDFALRYPPYPRPDGRLPRGM